jgi:RNA polymerase sigma-70 factor (ECF subfamily)
MSYAMTRPAQLRSAAEATVRDEASADSDAGLVRRAVGGDVHAFGRLVERYQRPMTALVARMTPNADDVDDIVQELFVRAWKGLPRFRGDAQFSTWLYRIAVNTTIKHRSRRREESALSLSTEELSGGMDSLVASPGAAEPGDPFLSAQRKEREGQIREAVLSLPEKQRAVIVLHYFEGHSCEEISEIVGCSVGTVWSRLHYACKRLKGALAGTLEREGVG